MKALVALIALVFTLGATVPAATLAVDEVVATHYRTKNLGSCASKNPEGALWGTHAFEYVRTVAGIRLWRKDGRKGPSLTYCLEVDNGFVRGNALIVAPDGSAIIKLPRWMRRHAESAQVVVNATCFVTVIGRSARGKFLWRLEADGEVPKPRTRRWRTREIPEWADNRTVTLTWQTECTL